MLDVPNKTSAKELTAKQMYMLFPTPMFTGKLPDIALCDRIENKLQELRTAGKGTFSPEGAILAYMTPDDIQTLPEMKPLVDVIMEETGIILDALAVKRDSHYITNMWANIANPNRRHFMHMHPNCLLSGLVYIKTPKNCGSTAFASPRLLSKKSRADLSAQERIEFRRVRRAGREGPHGDLAEPHSAFRRTRLGRRDPGTHRCRLQRHDPRADRSAHGAAEARLAKLWRYAAGTDAALSRGRQPRASSSARISFLVILP